MPNVLGKQEAFLGHPVKRKIGKFLN